MAVSNVHVKAKRLGWNETLTPEQEFDLEPYDYNDDNLEGELQTFSGNVEGVGNVTVYLVDGQEADPNTIQPLTSNAFCATGPGGGVDPTCSPGHTGTAASPTGGEKLSSGIVGKFKSIADAATAKVKGVAKALYDKLPKPAQKVVDMGIALEKKLEHGKEHLQQIAKAVGKERGLSDKGVERLGRILSIADNVNKWSAKIPAVGHPVSVALHHIGGPVGVIGHELSNYVPAASLAYVGYSMSREALAGRNPLKMIRAARERVKQSGTHNSLMGWMIMNDAEFADQVAEWLSGIPEERQDWAEALLAASLDEANGDKSKALSLAKGAYDPNEDLKELGA